MSELESIRDWFEFNARARRGYLDVFAKLSREELSRDRGASYPTLLDILAHSAGEAVAFWLGKFAMDPASLPQLENSSDPSLDDVRGYLELVSLAMKQVLDGLREQDLDRTVRLPQDGPFSRDHELSVRDILWHLVEEELQHRGELNALLWQLDVDPPIFDWIDWVEIPGRRNISSHPASRDG